MRKASSLFADRLPPSSLLTPTTVCVCVRFEWCLQVTREMLNDKISELNSAIDGVSQQLQSRTSGQESQVENL